MPNYVYILPLVRRRAEDKKLQVNHKLGDTISSNGIYTNEAVAECEKHLNSILYFVSPSGKFYNTADTQNAKLAAHALTYANDSELQKITPE